SQEVLLKCPRGNNSDIIQCDDVGNLKVNNGTRGNIGNKDTGRCISRAADQTGFYTEKPETFKLCVDWP
uniref:Uncharacterized protein n=1 Tax=Propithecus coquereli TaxID=379532 RepID=A0A2K6ENC3_PROCO